MADEQQWGHPLSSMIHIPLECPSHGSGMYEDGGQLSEIGRGGHPPPPVPPTPPRDALEGGVPPLPPRRPAYASHLL